VLVFALNVPLLLQLPLTVNVFVPVIVKLAPELIEILLHTAPAAFILGKFETPEGIVTLSDDVGTVPLHQLEAVNQSVLVVPVQEPATNTVTVTAFEVTVQGLIPLTTTS
jgi:hypothetical protein